MTKSFLIIVEGAVTEPSIFESILKKYGFNVKIAPQIKNNDFKIENYTFLGTEVVIAQGPQNRIKDMLAEYNSGTMDLNRVFSMLSRSFAGIFIIYDVDHTDNITLEKSFECFCDETEGLLLVSSPCIEVIADTTDTPHEFYGLHLSKYKSCLNVKCDELYSKSAKQYIIDNFEECILYFLDKNTLDFNEKNIMEHPKKVINWINKYNQRNNSPSDNSVKYRYFTTVVYVAIAYILGLTKNIDNYSKVREFFKSHLEKH